MAIVVNSNSISNDIEKQDTNILTKKLVNNINSYLFDRIEQLKLYDNSYNLTIKKRGAGYIICYNLVDSKAKKNSKKDNRNYYEISIRTLKKNGRVLVSLNIDGNTDYLSLNINKKEVLNISKVKNVINKLIDNSKK
ncbi:MAG: hypothetical protein WBH72_00590 [Bacteroidales bacterium]